MLLRPCGGLESGTRALPGHGPRETASTRPVRQVGRRPGAPVRAVLREAVPVREGVRLAVDVGSVRVGVARSDPGGILASPLTVVRSGPGELDELAKLAVSVDAIEVIVGLPTSLSGREGAAAAAARSFAADLAARVAPIPVRLVDERFTTTEAHDALRRSGKDSRARRGLVDAAAAAVLLQAALDAERVTGRPPGRLVTGVGA
jgi:putative holliday junction resolvase